MAADQNARGKSIQFLDEVAFDSILGTSRDRYAGIARDKLEHFEGATARTEQRYHDYTSSEQIRDRLWDDLSSAAAPRMQRRSKAWLADMPDGRTTSKGSAVTWASARSAADDCRRLLPRLRSRQLQVAERARRATRGDAGEAGWQSLPTSLLPRLGP